MSTQIINLSLPEELLKRVDKMAKSQYASRSEFIRQTLVNRLQAQDDAWGALAAGAEEVRAGAKQAGYVTDKDFARAVREVRHATNNQ